MRLTSGPDWSHRTGQAFLTTWTPELVAAAPDPVVGLSNYMEQILGVGFPTQKDLLVLRKRIKEIFQHYPAADYHTLCRLVRYNKSIKRRFSRVYTVMDSFREAMAAGWLPELTNATSETAETHIRRILETETDPRWRARLLACRDDSARHHMIECWESSRVPA